MSPNSLKNLRAPWKRGECGNPRGRPAAGAALVEWLDAMTGYTRDELRAVLADPLAPAVKLAATRVWLDATSSDRTMAEHPIAGPEVDRIADRTIGRAVARNVNADVQAGPIDDADGERIAILQAAGWAIERWPPRLAALHEEREEARLASSTLAASLSAS